MSSKPEPLKVDETTASALRLMRFFLKLRNPRHRDELIVLAERLVEQEAKEPAVPVD